MTKQSLYRVLMIVVTMIFAVGETVMAASVTPVVEPDWNEGIEYGDECLKLGYGCSIKIDDYDFYLSDGKFLFLTTCSGALIPIGIPAYPNSLDWKNYGNAFPLSVIVKTEIDEKTVANIFNYNINFTEDVFLFAPNNLPIKRVTLCYKKLFEPKAIEILEFFDQSVSDGTLIGVGKSPQAANGKLAALRNMLVNARYLISAALFSDACEQLNDAYKKTDGQLKPPDFVSGNSADDLAQLIMSLIADLGCQ